jgi:glycosyltransferase involved in cell wall biosynthesis
MPGRFQNKKISRTQLYELCGHWLEKMRILVVNTHVPFIQGGAEFLAYNLTESLKRHGHKVEEVKIPFKWYPPERILDHILASRLTDLTESCGEPVDLTIGLKFPSYFIKHHNKVLWVLHQYRSAYNFWETEYSDLLGEKGASVRDAIIKADNTYIPEARKVLTISKTVSDRLRRYNNIDSKPIYHPPPNHEKLYSGKHENYIFFPSRLSVYKRQHLAIKAMKHVKSNIKLIIAGAPDNESYESSLKDLIKKHSLYSSVELRGAISEEEKRELYANALAVLFIPYEEDLGYVTLEAFYSRKMVITCSDSGGPTEFVRDNETGLICLPEPASIADAIDSMTNNKNKAVNYGKSGYDLIKEMDLSWDKVIEELVS